jgi:methyl-accepting chemotaxis protein
MVLVSLVMMAMVNPVIAQQSAPTSEKAKQIEVLVNEAAALIESKGKTAFEEFRQKDTKWFSGDTYLFVYDLKSNVLLNVAFPAREGTNTTGQKDANGKLFHHDFIQMAKSPKGSGWVDYMFPKPGQTQPSQKWAYVRGFNLGGVPSLVASGFYLE